MCQRAKGCSGRAVSYRPSIVVGGGVQSGAFVTERAASEPRASMKGCEVFISGSSRGFEDAAAADATD